MYAYRLLVKGNQCEAAVDAARFLPEECDLNLVNWSERETVFHLYSEKDLTGALNRWYLHHMQNPYPPGTLLLWSDIG